MIVAVIAAIVALTGTVGVIVWLVRIALSDRARTADVLFDLVTAQSDLERSQFELEVTKKSLDVANARADVLEEELTHAIQNAPALGDGLAANDVGGRVLRLAQRWREAAGAGREVPAVGAGPVLVPSATDAPDAGR